MGTPAVSWNSSRYADAMALERIAVLGIGSVRCAPAILGALGTYFGERELEVRLFDADAERLDLFDRLGRLCLLVGEAPHRRTAHDDWREALETADAAILCIGENCARHMLGVRKIVEPAEDDAPSPMAQRARTRREVLVPRATGSREDALAAACEPVFAALQGVRTLSLVRDAIAPFESWPWPAPPTEAERRALPHQVLRWVRGEDPVRQLLDAHADSPLRAWLDRP